MVILPGVSIKLSIIALYCMINKAFDRFRYSIILVPSVKFANCRRIHYFIYHALWLNNRRSFRQNVTTFRIVFYRVFKYVWPGPPPAPPELPGEWVDRQDPVAGDWDDQLADGQVHQQTVERGLQLQIQGVLFRFLYSSGSRYLILIIFTSSLKIRKVNY